jgi:alpha-galactosidase/6-phospho-beta-glucosidase family protein
MANLKITIIGGGSYSWTPGILSNIAGGSFLDGCTVMLHDINPEALSLLHQWALKYKQLSGSAITFEQSGDLHTALAGSDYVLVTISTGALVTMRADLEVPEKYGIFQTVGDTVGPGGLSRTLRNVPVFLGIARAMEQVCPQARMVNYSNPLSAITRAVTRETSIRAVGFCHGVLGVANAWRTFFGVPWSECSYVNSGIDHCSWFTEYVVSGRPAIERLREMGVEEWLTKPPAEAKADPKFGSLYALRQGTMLGLQLGALPAIGDRHMVEFFPTFLQSLGNVERYGLVRTTIDERAGHYTAAKARIKDMLAREEPIERQHGTDVVGERHADDFSAWVSAMEGKSIFEDNANAPNRGQIPQLPEGAIVETRAIIDGAGLHPLVSPLSPQLTAVVRPHVEREELSVEAAIEGSFAKALAVLVTDPLLEHPEVARPLLEELLAANAEWLPQFSAKG